MDQNDLWTAFKKTGRIEDYLRYCGVDIYQNMSNSLPSQEGGCSAGGTVHAADDRRPNHPGKQQHR